MCDECKGDSESSWDRQAVSGPGVLESLASLESLRDMQTIACSRAAVRRAGAATWERGRPGRPGSVAAPLCGALCRKPDVLPER